MLEQLLFFPDCLSIQFLIVFNSPPSPKTVSKATIGNLSLTVEHLCDLWDAMPCIDHQAFPNPFPRKGEDFHRGEKYRKHVPLIRYLAYFQRKEISYIVLFMC